MSHYEGTPYGKLPEPAQTGLAVLLELVECMVIFEGAVLPERGKRMAPAPPLSPASGVASPRFTDGGVDGGAGDWGGGKSARGGGTARGDAGAKSKDKQRQQEEEEEKKKTRCVVLELGLEEKCCDCLESAWGRIRTLRNSCIQQQHV